MVRVPERVNVPVPNLRQAGPESEATHQNPKHKNGDTVTFRKFEKSTGEKKQWPAGGPGKAESSRPGGQAPAGEGGAGGKGSGTQRTPEGAPGESPNASAPSVSQAAGRVEHTAMFMIF